MPPEPYEYQGRAAIAAFLRDRTEKRGAPLLVPTRANGQPAFGVYFAEQLFAMFVLALEGDQISGITWLPESSVSPLFGLS